MDHVRGPRLSFSRPIQWAYLSLEKVASAEGVESSTVHPAPAVPPAYNPQHERSPQKRVAPGHGVGHRAVRPAPVAPNTGIKTRRIFTT